LLLATDRQPRKRTGSYRPPADGSPVEPETDDEKNAAADPLPVASPPPRTTKAKLLLSMVERPGGALMAELTEATGWLPHTVRAALTGLRKKGNIIDRGTRDGRTCYQIGSRQG